MVSRYGVNVHLASRHTLQYAAQLGCGSVRIDGVWPMLQPDRHTWNWTLLDDSIYGARERGMEVLLCLGGTPPWANGGQGTNVAPDLVADWVTFVRTVAERYRHNVWMYSVWNEPNITGFYTGSVMQYVNDLFIPAAAVLHSIGPEIRVGGPELSTEGDWVDWFRTMLRYTYGVLDFVAVHCYAKDGRAVWRKLAQRPEWWEFWRDPCVRDVIRDSAARDIEVVVSEVGWNTAKISEAHQASSYDQLLEGWATQGWVKALYAYQLISEPHPVGWGLFREDGTPKPAVEVMQRYTGQGGIV